MLQAEQNHNDVLWCIKVLERTRKTLFYYFNNAPRTRLY